MQQENDTDTATTLQQIDWKTKEKKVLQWPNQSEAHTMIEMLLWDLKRAVHKQVLTNLNKKQ